MNGTYLLVAFIVGAAVLAIIFKQSSLQGDWPIQTNALAYAMETFEEDVMTAEESEEHEGFEGEEEDSEEFEGYEDEDDEDAEKVEGYEGRASTDEHDETDDAMETFDEHMRNKGKTSFGSKMADLQKRNKAKREANKGKGKGKGTGKGKGKGKTPPPPPPPPPPAEEEEGFEGFEDAVGQMPYLGNEYAAI